MSKNNEGKKVAILGEAGRQAYEGSVMHRMQGRAGAYSQTGSSGIALEIMANDKANIKNLSNPGAVTKLTKSPVAQQVDAVTMKGGKVIERIQYKDTPSVAGIQKTLKQVESGKYNQVQLRGTTETAQKFNQMAEKRGIAKQMQSTGISSETTKRVGSKFTGHAPGMASMGNLAKTTAINAGGITAGIEIAKSVINGDSVSECTSNVVSKSAESALAAGTAALVGEATTVMLGSIIAGPIAIPISIGASLAAAQVTSEVTDGIFDDVANDIGRAVEDVADGISNMVSDIGSGVCSFFGGIFG